MITVHAVLIYIYLSSLDGGRHEYRTRRCHTYFFSRLRMEVDMITVHAVGRISLFKSSLDGGRHDYRTRSWHAYISIYIFIRRLNEGRVFAYRAMTGNGELGLDKPFVQLKGPS